MFLESKLEELENEINAKSNKNDWHKTKTATRSLTLKLLYICQRMIEYDDLNSSTWKETYLKYEPVFKIKLEYQAVKEIVRYMRDRYQREEKDKPGKRHQKYEIMLQEGRDFYRRAMLYKNQM